MDKPPSRSGISYHSTMMLWLMENRAKFASELKEAGRPSWKRIAERFADLDLRDARGGKPTALTIQKAWKRITKKPIRHSAYIAPKPIKQNEIKEHQEPAQDKPPSDPAAMRERLRQMTNKRSVR